MATPEDQARAHIDQALVQADWKVQDYKSAHLHAGRGVVLGNFPLVSGLEVERRLSVIEELEAAVEANLTRADRLRQSILAKAFCGELTTLQ